jgi:hypothetical protein
MESEVIFNTQIHRNNFILGSLCPAFTVAVSGKYFLVNICKFFFFVYLFFTPLYFLPSSTKISYVL